ncbi:PilW family protein [Marinobacter sp. 1Y8]
MIRPVADRTYRNRQQGLSLIELMIAMALGLVLTLGVVEIFLSSSKTYRLTDSVARLQENLRFTLSNLTHDGRMAGHSGCLVGQPVNHIDTGGSSDLELIYGNNAIAGWDYSATGLGNAVTLSSFAAATAGWTNGSGDNIPAAISGSAIVNSDILVLNTADLTGAEINGGGASSLNTADATGIAKSTVVVVTAGDCSGGDMFQNTDEASDSSLNRSGAATPGNTATEDLGQYDSDSSVYSFRSTAYYVGVGTGGEPALFRERLDAGSSGAEELATGVENMQVLYGVTGVADKQVDQYVSADNVTDWALVASVRLAFLIRSDDNSIETTQTQTFNLIGTEVTSPSDRRARLVGTSTVGIRNRLE